MMLNIRNCSSSKSSTAIKDIMTKTNVQSEDEVDYVFRLTGGDGKNIDTKGEDQPHKRFLVQKSINNLMHNKNHLNTNTAPISGNSTSTAASTNIGTIAASLSNNNIATTNSNSNNNIKPSLSTLDKLSLFTFSKKITSKSTTCNSNLSKGSSDVKISSNGDLNLNSREGSLKIVRGASLARLFGNTYNTKKFEKELSSLAAASGSGATITGGHVDLKTKFNTFSGRRKSSGPYLERFRKCCREDEDIPNITSSCVMNTNGKEGVEGENSGDLSVKAIRTISRGLGRLWKRTHSVEISSPDPEYKVSYLGNVLTGWAKGDGCVEKQLNTLWRNYTQNNKPDVIMRIKVCASGLKATTRQHGLTEYWANRITHCCAPKNFPRVFCWIYRHEGRKLKHELRCHAVLCSKEKVVQEICSILKENLERALREFKREKILKQNARLSLANSAYDNPSLPRRKILLSVGGNNYRPPLERSKSAPKLMAIEEAIGEEDGEDVEETNEPEMRACCQKDSLYPAMTLGRRKCRRGHSIRRTGKIKPTFYEASKSSNESDCSNTKENYQEVLHIPAEDSNEIEAKDIKKSTECLSDEDDFEKLLMFNNYDIDSPLAGELLPYLDMQMHKTNVTNSLTDLAHNDHDHDDDTAVVEEHPNFASTDLTISPEVSHTCSITIEGICSDDDDEVELIAHDLFFRQTGILNILDRNSMRKLGNFSISSEESSLENQGTNGGQLIASNRKQLSMDSDEGSISSGCETASTVTANIDDMSLKYRHKQQQKGVCVPDKQNKLQIPKKLVHAKEDNCQRNSSILLLSGRSSVTRSTPPMKPSDNVQHTNQAVDRDTGEHGHADGDGDGFDSECSDESGYVEFQDMKAMKSSQRLVGTSTAV